MSTVKKFDNGKFQMRVNRVRDPINGGDRSDCYEVVAYEVKGRRFVRVATLIGRLAYEHHAVDYARASLGLAKYGGAP